MSARRPLIAGLAAAGAMCLAAGASATTLIEAGTVEAKPIVEGRVPPEQAAVAQVADAITRVNDLLATLQLTDQAALSVEYEPDLIRLHTHRGLPLEVTAAVEKAASPTPLQIAVSPYSAGELDAEAKRLLDHPDVVWAGANDDLSGLVVGLRVGADPDPEVTSRYPVTIDPVRSNLVSASRNRDVSPVWGGAFMRNKQSQTACSAGVSVSVSAGTRVGFTTAQHCATGTWQTHDGPVNTLGETTSIANVQADTRFVEADTSSQGRAWIDGWNSTTSRVVSRAQTNPANGQRVCTNGGLTSEVCGQTYVRGGGYAEDENGVRRGPGFWILGEGQTGNVFNCIANKGDSGSPVHNYTSAGDLEVRGLLIGVDTFFSTSYCPYMHPSYIPSPISTTHRAFAINIVAALNSIGATPRTGG